MSLLSQVSEDILKEILNAGRLSNEFATYQKTKFWDYETLKTWNSNLENDLVMVVKIEKNHLVGFLLGTILFNRIVTIENIYVSPNERNSGIATSLINFVKKNYSIHKNIIIRSMTQNNNKSALSMFLKLGFEKSEPTKWIYKRNLQKSNFAFAINNSQKLSEKIELWPNISTYINVLDDIYIHPLRSNFNDYGRIVVSTNTKIKKATIESIILHESSIKLKAIEFELFFLTEHLFNLGYNLVTIHPKLLSSDIIAFALNAGFQEGNSFIPVQKWI